MAKISNTNKTRKELTANAEGQDENCKTFSESTNLLSRSGSGSYKRPDEAIAVPGTPMWTFALNPINRLEALHKSGFYIEGLSVEEYLLECIKIAREVCKREWKMIILPLGSKVRYDIIHTWIHVYNRLCENERTGKNHVEISVKHRTLTMDRKTYKENG